MVEGSVRALIIEAIDEQLAYFRQDNITETLYQIIVRPYNKLVDTEYISQELLLSKNGEEYLIFRSMKLGIGKVERGYCVYAEESNVPVIHLIHYLLLRCGRTIIHSGGVVDVNGEGILTPGVAGVGKTSLSIHLVRNCKYRLVGDDYVILKQQWVMNLQEPKMSSGVSTMITEHMCASCHYCVKGDECERWDKKLSQNDLYRLRELECWTEYRRCHDV